MSLPSVTLWNHIGSSDKIYKLSIEESGSGYVVNYANGRRGATLTTGTKTNSPVTLAAATKIYEKKLKEQLGKFYEVIEGDGGTGIGSSVITDKQQADTGLRPQLLNPITEDEAEQYLDDDDWCGQEKFDGKRMTVRRAAEVVAANKKGLSIGFPDAISKAASAIAMSFVTDGESIGDNLHVFDLLEAGDKNYREEPYEFRLGMLEYVLGKGKSNIIVAETAIGTEAKRAMMMRLRKEGKEGIVFKRLSSKWYAGRPASGGSAVKCKFWESLSCVVSKVNAKRSIKVSLEGQDIGNVTIPANKDIPDVGMVVEIKYLYVSGKGGSLYQPIYLGPRDDVDIDECTFKAQRIKYKDQAVTEDGEED